jgi:hypothetical protein
MVVGWISAENVGHFEEKMKIWKGAQEDDRQKGRRRVTIRYRVITLGGHTGSSGFCGLGHRSDCQSRAIGATRCGCENKLHGFGVRTFRLHIVMRAECTNVVFCSSLQLAWR